MKLYEEQADGTLVPVQDMPEQLRVNLERYLKLRDAGLGLEEIRFLWALD